jgi:hypothetical protein
MVLEECRAEVIAAYLALDRNIFATMGYTNDSSISADDCKPEN